MESDINSIYDINKVMRCFPERSIPWRWKKENDLAEASVQAQGLDTEATGHQGMSQEGASSQCLQGGGVLLHRNSP